MNVLHLISGRGPTGPAAAAISDARALLSTQTSVAIASRDDGYIPIACNRESVPFVGGLKLGRGARRILSLRHDSRRLCDIVRELSIDVVHVHRSDDHITAYMALRALPAALIRTLHRDPRTIPSPLLKNYCAKTDGILCVAKEHVLSLQERGISSEFIHAAADTDAFRPQTKKEGPFVIGHIGRWKLERDGRDRGQRAALKIFSMLPRTGSWSGILAGRGEQEHELRREAYDVLKLSPERVKLVDLTHLSLDEYAKLVATFSLGLVFACGSDGTSRAACEMLSCGVPLLVADLPGLREMAEDDSCAQRLLADDPTGWAAAIQRLVGAPERLAAMGVAARARAESTHSLKARGEALARFYAKCR